MIYPPTGGKRAKGSAFQTVSALYRVKIPYTFQPQSLIEKPTTTIDPPVPTPRI
jgi:hypothetical protein